MSYGYSNLSADDYDSDGSSDLVDNLKKLAIEEVMNRARQAQLMLANNPTVMATAGAGAAMGALVGARAAASSVIADGLSAFSGQLAEVWSSPVAGEIGTSIDTAVTTARDRMDDVYQKAHGAYWAEEDKVPSDSDEADPKWK